MQGPDDRGYWHIQLEDAQPGMDYAFLLDDDPTPYPDPRSCSQPQGVDGPSRLYDHRAFQWTDGTWQGPPLSSAVIYELHVGTFTPDGTLDSAIEKIPYLCDLGVTHIEVMPVAEAAGDHGWGYDGVDLFAVNHHYGGPDALKRFVDACHANGLAVLLDVVYNHFGPVGNYTGKFGPYVTDKHRTPWGPAINFEDIGSDEVRSFFFDNAAMWLRDFHVDGLRLDAIHEIMDRSAVHFLEDLSAHVNNLSAMLGRSLVLIAESDLNNPMIVAPIDARGFGMDAQWSDDFHHALFTILHQEAGGYYDDFGTIAALAKAIKEVFVYDGNYSAYRKRSHGRPVNGLSSHRFVVCIQNHDQVGNRAVGDRLEHLIGPARTKVALGILLTSPFVPLLFQGEEFAASSPFMYFADHKDPEMAKSVAAGRKKEFAAFGWDEDRIPDPEDCQTFLNSQLQWDEVGEPRHTDMLQWTRRLVHLRRNSSCLNDGDPSHVRVSFDEEKKWLRIDRKLLSILVNLGKESVEFEALPDQQLVLSSAPDVKLDAVRLELPPDALAVLSAE
jgi:maltooligosyltrehalose trehalohydrolase